MKPGQVAQQQTFFSSDSISQAADQSVEQLTNLFPSDNSALPLQVTFPVIQMHPYADWLPRNIQCVPSNDIITLRNTIVNASTYTLMVRLHTQTRLITGRHGPS